MIMILAIPSIDKTTTVPIAMGRTTSHAPTNCWPDIHEHRYCTGTHIQTTIWESCIPTWWFITIIYCHYWPLSQSILVIVSRCHGFMVICLLAVVIDCNRNKQGKIQAMSMVDPNLTTAPFLVHVELIAIHLILLSLPHATKNIAIS